MLQLVDVSLKYGRVLALKEVTLEFREGITVVLGANGSGKTTLLLTSAGLLRPTSGKVLLDGKDLFSLGRKVRKEFGLLFQNPRDQLIGQTVYEDVSLGPRQLGIDGVEEVMRRLGIWELRDRSPLQLSQGQASLVALAGVLSYNPNYVLLDEPSSSLDYRSLNLLVDVLAELKGRGKVVVVATQDTEFASWVADRVVLLDEGKVKGMGDPSLLEDPDLLVSVGVRPRCLDRR